MSWPAPVPTFPLTDLPAGDAAVVSDRRSVAAEIDGLGGIPAVWGVEQSDMVVEVVVEGGLTRLIAIFQSRDPARIGPVRSVRTSDFGVLTPLKRPLLVFSGGNEGTVQMARSAPLLAFMPLSAEGDDVFWRVRSLRAPHNLFAPVPEVRSHAEQGMSPQPLFDFSPNAPVGRTVGTVKARLTWTLRSADGAPMALAPGRTWMVVVPGFARITSE